MQYHLECPCLGTWNRFKSGSKGYCEGYLDALRGQAPHLNIRMVRDDGKIMDEIAAKDEVNIGQVAGWPTAAQYERAGYEALRRAELIKSREAERARRNGFVYGLLPE